MELLLGRPWRALRRRPRTCRTTPLVPGGSRTWDTRSRAARMAGEAPLPPWAAATRMGGSGGRSCAATGGASSISMHTDRAGPVESLLHFQGSRLIQVFLQHRPFSAEQLVNPVPPAPEQASRGSPSSLPVWTTAQCSPRKRGGIVPATVAGQLPGIRLPPPVPAPADNVRQTG